MAVNDEILQRTIRHAIQVQRYGAGASRRMVQFLDQQVYPDLVATITRRLAKINSRGMDTGPWTTQRYKDLIIDVGQILNEAAKQMKLDTGSDLRSLAKGEADWARRMLQVAVPKELQVDVSGINLNAVQQVVTRPILGEPLGKWFAGLAVTAKRNLTRQIGIGLAIGEPADLIIRRVRSSLDVPRNHAATIVRTASNQVSTQAREVVYAENPDIIDSVMWVSTLDTRTSAICRSLDGKTFPIDSGQRPPAHPNCRSVVTPVLKSYKDLARRGIKVDMGTRASMDGQVPASLSYGDWMKTQSIADQNDALGAGRAALWRAGKVSMSDMVGTDGRELSLAELSEKL